MPGVIGIAFEIPVRARILRLSLACGIPGAHDDLALPSRQAQGGIPETPGPAIRLFSNRRGSPGGSSISARVRARLMLLPQSARTLVPGRDLPEASLLTSGYR